MEGAALHNQFSPAAGLASPHTSSQLTLDCPAVPAKQLTRFWNFHTLLLLCFVHALSFFPGASVFIHLPNGYPSLGILFLPLPQHFRDTHTITWNSLQKMICMPVPPLCDNLINGKPLLFMFYILLLHSQYKAYGMRCHIFLI